MNTSPTRGRVSCTGDDLDPPVPTGRTPPPRPVGRPRDPGVDAATLEATFELLASEGYGGLTIEAVAARAGVSKNAIYRRWKDKVALVLDSIEHHARPERPTPDTGDFRADFTTVLDEMVSALAGFDGQLVRSVISDIARHPELADAFRTTIIASRRAALRARVERAVERGELPATTDAELLTELGPALLYHQLLFSREPPGPDLPARIVAQFVPEN